MESVIVEYLRDGYAIQCSSKDEINICKDAFVKLCNGTRSEGARMNFPYVGLDNEDSMYVVGYSKPNSFDRVIVFSDMWMPPTEDVLDNISDIM